MRVQTILQKTLVPHLPKVHAKRRNLVFEVTAALLKAKTLSSAAIGRMLPGTPKHQIKRVDRLLGHSKLYNELITFFSAVAATVLSRFRTILLVDWTRLNDGFAALSAAVPIGGRAIPVYFEVHPLEDWHKTSVHDEFLERLAIVIGDRQATLITDAGYQATWFKKVRELGWDFVGHLNPTTKVTPDGTEPSWELAQQYLSNVTQKPQSLGPHLISKQSPMPATLIVTKSKRKGRHGTVAHKRAGVAAAARKKATSPTLLATSLTQHTAKRIVALYKMRMQIEESFRDAKSYRFGWSLTLARSRFSNRWAVLLLLASLAMLVTCLVGAGGEKTGIQRAYQANTVRSRRVLSLVTLGELILLRGEVTQPISSLISALRALVDSFCLLREAEI